MSDNNKTTEIIDRIADAVTKKSSGEIPAAHPWKCEQDNRLDRVEQDVKNLDKRVEETEDALHEGNTRFVRLESKLEAVSEKLSELSDSIRSATRWALGIFGTAALGWVIVNMGKEIK